MPPAIGAMPPPFIDPIELIDPFMESLIDDFAAGLPPELSVTPRITPTTTTAIAPRPVQRRRGACHQRDSRPGLAAVTGPLLSDSLLTRCLLASGALRYRRITNPRQALGPDQLAQRPGPAHGHQQQRPGQQPVLVGSEEVGDVAGGAELCGHGQ